MSGTPDDAVTAAPDMYNASYPFSAHYLPTIPLYAPGIIKHFYESNFRKSVQFYLNNIY
jgi:hypothetical protein